jgi:hypothetical protein
VFSTLVFIGLQALVNFIGLFRRLDLMGKNLRKVEGMVTKINSKQGKDKTLGFLSRFLCLQICLTKLLTLLDDPLEIKGLSREI